MPETDTIPVSASTASTGLGIRYIGDYAYASSGKVLSTGSGGADDILLEFVSGTGLIVSTLDFQNDITSSADVYFEIKFNDETIVLNKEAASSITEPWTFKLLIPPFTKVKIGWGLNPAQPILMERFFFLDRFMEKNDPISWYWL